METNMLRNGDYWLVIDDRLVIASETKRKVTVDLYRNLDDYKEREPMAVDQKIELVVPHHSI